MRPHVSVALDAPGPWILHRIEGHPVYLRADKDARCVAACWEEAGGLYDLGAACDVDRSDLAQFIVHPQQAAWARTASIQRLLLERALVVWRRHGTGEPGAVVTRQFGEHVYEFWADTAAERVEFTRRAQRPAEVVIEEYLGFGDRLGAATAEIRLRSRAGMPAEVLRQIQALTRDTWQRALAAQAGTEGAV